MLDYYYLIGKYFIQWIKILTMLFQNWIWFIAPLLIGVVLSEPCSNIIDYQSVWNEGASGTIHAKFPITTSSWHMIVTFDSPIIDFEVYVGGNSIIVN